MTDVPRATPLPPAPRTLEDAGLTRDSLTELLLKTLYFSGEMSGPSLAKGLGLPYAVVEPGFEFLKRERLAEISGGALLGEPSYVYRLGDAGRARAALFLQRNHYVGRAPVPLEQYRAYLERFQAATARPVSPASIGQAFSHLVLSQETLDQLGAAINGGHSLFVYGPPGNGKTLMSQAVGRLLEDAIAIPYAIGVEGHIVRVYDPVNHEALQPPDAIDDDLQPASRFDRRWVICRRPVITVGGELTLESLDLTYNPATGFYRAPLQVLANGGVLILDDFGRQRSSPRELLNRWIVPLESRIDFLTLQTGQSFAIPFLALVIFATNIRPIDLVDEAFLRRIQYKVYAGSPTPDQFVQIFENCCRELAIECDRAIVEALLDACLRPRGIALRGCHPRDLINQALARASYRGDPRRLTLALLEAACASYFVDDREPAAHA